MASLEASLLPSEKARNVSLLGKANVTSGKFCRSTDTD
jgi:hypothetical protein